jgi:hypothetical protein
MKQTSIPHHKRISDTVALVIITIEDNLQRNAKIAAVLGG